MKIDFIEIIKNKMRNYFTFNFVVLITLLFVIGGIMTLIGIFITVEAVEYTSDAEFCGSCHSMKSMTVSWRKSVHGGNNKLGCVAKCADCHLPHSNVLEYLTVKSINGTNDLFVEMFGEPEKIDWQERRKNREHFVYDSGCMKCHKNLKNATMSNPKAFIAHKNYFLGTSNKKCVSCHKNSGHKNLGLYLN